MTSLTYLHAFCGDDVFGELVQLSRPPAGAPVPARTRYLPEHADVLVQDQLGQGQLEWAAVLGAPALEHLVRLHPAEGERTASLVLLKAQVPIEMIIPPFLKYFLGGQAPIVDAGTPADGADFHPRPTYRALKEKKENYFIITP